MSDTTQIEAASPALELTVSRVPETEEAALIQRCRKGDLSAFDELVRQHQSRMYSLAFRLMGDSDSAQDCAQDAFIRAFTSLRSFRGDCAFTTWLHRIVTNICLDELRRRKPKESLTAEEDAPDPIERLADGNPGPEQSLLQAERKQLVWRAMEQLPDHQRAVLVLFDIEGLSYEEIAAHLRASIGTVKSRLNRARLALKEKLEPVRELFGA